MAELLSDDATATPVREQFHHKRPHGTPTMQTPHRPAKKAVLRREAEFLPSASQAKPASWSEGEMKALVEFVLFFCRIDSWPTHKDEVFLKNAAEFVQKRTNTTRAKTGKLSTASTLTAKS